MMNIKTSSVSLASAESINQTTKKHLRGSTLLLVGRGIALATNFAVQILTVRLLSKSDYGAFAYALQLASLGASISVFGLDKTITRFVPIYQEKEDYNKLFGTIFMMVGTILSLGFFLGMLVLGLREWLAQSFISDQLAVSLLMILIFLSPMDALDSFLMGMFATFASPRSIFFRKHVLGPGLKLSVVLLLIFWSRDAYFLAWGYLMASILGVVLYSGILIHHLRKSGLFRHLDIQRIQFPVREVFGFSIPLLTTDLVFLLRSTLVVVMLGYFHSTVDVASFRAVLPVARLNMVVIQSFTFLFMPMAARMFAREDRKGINDLYWQSAMWIAVISFPIFVTTFSLAQPLTLLLFGTRYAQSGIIMALLSFGYYFNAALGFNADTLRVYGKVRYIIMIDLLAVIVSLGLSLWLIPRYGALGAAIAVCGTLVAHNIFNHAGLKFVADIKLFQWRYLRVYLSIALSALGLVFFQSMISVPIYVDFFLAALLSLLVLIINWNILNVEETFPELLRFEIVQRLLSKRKNDNTV